MTTKEEKARRMDIRRKIGGRELPPVTATSWPRSRCAYLSPFVCFSCRRSFKRNVPGRNVTPCPNCGAPSIWLTRKFKAPRQIDRQQWKKVEALVRHGFVFESMDEPYPEKLSEVDAFAERHAAYLRDQRRKAPEFYAALETAFAVLDSATRRSV